MITRSSRAHLRGTRSPGRWRLLAAVAAPIALAATAAAPATAQPAYTARPAAQAASHDAQAGRSLTLPALSARQVTVTLITGDRVTLDRVAPGRYSISSDPGIDEVTGLSSAKHVTSLQAFPGSAGSLLSAGLVNRGLFDLTYLAAHGDTGPHATIPVTIAYPDHPAAATLTARARAIPDGHLFGVSAASGQVRLAVPAAQAARFWAALTGAPADGRAAPHPGGAHRPAPQLAGGADQIWLTGHQVASATADPQDGQPLYPLAFTVTGKPAAAGPLTPACGANWGLPGGGSQWFDSSFCPDAYTPFLVEGVAGSGEGQFFAPSSAVCTTATPHTPNPICSAWRFTFQVPAGIYAASQLGHFATTTDLEGTEQTANAVMSIPQITVTGPTAITFNATKLIPVHLSTPQPAQHYSSGVQEIRGIPSGGSFFIGYATEFFYTGGWWVLPTAAGEQATVGNYHMQLSFLLGQPPVTAAVTSPQHLTLHPLYQAATDWSLIGSSVNIRFTGQQALRLVDAGEGTASDFAKIGARGKLALIHEVDPTTGCNPNPFPGQLCGDGVLPAQLADAKQAGAAGVLFDVSHYQGDPSMPDSLPNGFSCGCGSLSFSQYDIPFAEVSEAEAASLRSLLARGPVTITIDDHGDSPYLYNIAPVLEGSVPGSFDYTVSPRTFTRVEAAFHSTAAGEQWTKWTPWSPDDPIGWLSNGASFNRRTVTEYFGPDSPSLAWDVQSGTFSDPFDFTEAVQIFGQPGTTGENWDEAPTVPGAAGPFPGVAQEDPNNPFFMSFCAGCRQGNTFWPFFSIVNGATPLTRGVAADVVFQPATMHLYNAQGQEIPPDTSLGVPLFQLPQQQQRYRLDTQYQNPEQVNTFPSTVTTTWDFTSAEPATDNTPPETTCVGSFYLSDTSPCAAPPLVFLRYNAFTSLANTITAPGAHQLQVTGYHQDPSAPPVTSLKLWTSTDGGTAWQQATLTGGKNGTWTATYTLPQLSQTDSYLSIKAQAADSAGNDITQMIVDAVKLAAPVSGSASPHSR